MLMKVKYCFVFTLYSQAVSSGFERKETVLSRRESKLHSEFPLQKKDQLLVR